MASIIVFCFWARIRAPLFTIEAHPLYVAALEYSPDGQWLLSAGTIDQSVKLWDTHTGNLAHFITLEAGVTCAAFTPDSRAVVIGHKGHDVLLWDLQQFSSRNLLRHPDDGVSSLAISRDGAKLASGGCRGTIALYDLKSTLPVQTRTVGSTEVRSLAFRPNGGQLVAGTGDGRVLLISLRDEQLQEPLLVAKFSTPVQSVVISPNGDLLAIAGGTVDLGFLRVFDMVSLTQLWTADEQTCTSGIFSLDFSPTNALLAYGSVHDYPTIRLVNAEESSCVTAISSAFYVGHHTGITCVCFNPSGTLLASGDISGRVCVWTLPRDEDTVWPQYSAQP